MVRYDKGPNILLTKKLYKYGTGTHAPTTFLNLCCGSGSGQIGFIFSNPDPEPDPFQSTVKLKYTFSRKFHYIVKNIENYDTNSTYDANEKEKTM